MWREREERKKKGSFSPSRNNRPITVPPQSSIPLLSRGEELVTAQLWEQDKYIYISRRICPSQLGCGAGQSLIVPRLARSRKAPQFGAGRAPALPELGTSWNVIPDSFDWSRHGVGRQRGRGGSYWGLWKHLGGANHSWAFP